MPLELVTNFRATGDQPRAIEQLTGWIRAGHTHATLLGVTGSGKTFTMAGVIANTQRPTLVISPNKTLAAQLYGEFKEFFPSAAVHYFVSYYDYYQPEAYVPQSDTYIEKEAMVNEEIDRLRHAATQSLLTRKDVIIVASVSCIYGLGSPEEYGSVKILIRVGDRIERRVLLRQLVDLQFQRNDIDLTRGTFRVKGDTVEIFPKASDKDWIRIAWDGDAIERITARDISGATGSLEEVTIFPATHYVAAPAKFRTALDGIRQELEQQLRGLREQDKLLEAQRLEQRTRYDLQMLEETGYVHGIENYSRHFDSRTPGQPPFTLVDFYNYAYGGKLQADSRKPQADRACLNHKLGACSCRLAARSGWLCFIDESHITIPQLRGMYAGDRSRKETLVSYGFRLSSCLDNRPLRFDEFTVKVPRTIYVSATPEAYELSMSTSRPTKLSNQKTEQPPRESRVAQLLSSSVNEASQRLVAEQLIRPTGLLDPEVEVRPSEGQIPDLIREVQERVRKHQRVLVTVLTKRMAEDLAEYLNERMLPTPSSPDVSKWKKAGIPNLPRDSPSRREGEKMKKGFPPSREEGGRGGEGIRAYYLHADVETFERVEILDDLRRGRYDVVVGINLLREGLDLPEVSLVAILDADKEGYLRSRTALVQTMGRTARHAEGRVIMYADRMTESMRLAIAEVERRRKTQEAYNREHGITPTSIVKEIRGPIVALSSPSPRFGERGSERGRGVGRARRTSLSPALPLPRKRRGRGKPQ